MAAIEFALIAPLLITALLGSVTVFQLYRDSATAERSTYTIGDLLSHKIDIATTELDLHKALFVAMVHHPVGDTKFRVTSVKRKDNKFLVCWSYAPAPMTAMTTATIPATKMPLVANNDTVLLVETTVSSTPLFESVGIPVRHLTNFTAVRPRFTAAIKNTSVANAPC